MLVFPALACRSHFDIQLTSDQLCLCCCFAAQGIDKAALMNEVSGILHELSGTVYTGCDLNTSIEDMEILVGEVYSKILSSVCALF